ncbi:MAG: hypothetical protein CMH30_03675 [Micavibrio sp.]|nr:hypothetical protein [Micavibrio sp.]|tara:strand:+ start:472 stop:870 length:399 start_codon:yes stop_codon:yes gene_type:complete
MDEILERLKTTSANCAQAYADWSSSKKDGDKREALQNAVHELRKVSSRLEIEIAVSERDEQSRKAIPIPPHRASRNNRGDNKNKGKNKENNDLPDFIKSNDKKSDDKSKAKPAKRTTGKLTTNKSDAGGEEE